MLLIEVPWREEGSWLKFTMPRSAAGLQVEIYQRKVGGDYGFIYDDANNRSRFWAHGPGLDPLEAQAVLYHYLGRD